MQIKQEVLLGAPPVSVAGAKLFGYSLPEWAAIVAIVYTVLLIARLAWNFWKAFKTGKEIK